MKYSEQILEHFFNPRNVGKFNPSDQGIGKVVMGSYENGVLIHFQVQVCQRIIKAARFKAYGSCPIIAACSYATDWAINKTLEEAQQLTSRVIMNALAIPELKIHCALLVEDALKAAIANYVNNFAIE